MEFRHGTPGTPLTSRSQTFHWTFSNSDSPSEMRWIELQGNCKGVVLCEEMLEVREDLVDLDIRDCAQELLLCSCELPLLCLEELLELLVELHGDLGIHSDPMEVLEVHELDDAIFQSCVSSCMTVPDLLGDLLLQISPEVARPREDLHAPALDVLQFAHHSHLELHIISSGE